MFSGAHVIVHSKDAEADRAFFRDVLGFKSVDAGHGWLIFALPPAEAAFHPSDEDGVHELYFMCDDLKAEMASLAKKDVKCSKIEEARWGFVTTQALRQPKDELIHNLNHSVQRRFASVRKRQLPRSKCSRTPSKKVTGRKIFSALVNSLRRN